MCQSVPVAHGLFPAPQSRLSFNNFAPVPERLPRLNCTLNNDQSEQGPPQEAVLKAISEVSKTDGRVGETTNVMFPVFENAGA
ncbi:unnamed protein product [Eruca vesicaria subsp. sativa]|uniref:Uncharacterized protein n=1 Tax=Eruca vesicaria subsp. sativa TaxID=29727 RepID=A0ABC8LDM0_ERUVS|nr:unnamed protein product [Eruca vesicaria subsp. sativa]